MTIEKDLGDSKNEYHKSNAKYIKRTSTGAVPD